MLRSRWKASFWKVVLLLVKKLRLNQDKLHKERFEWRKKCSFVW
ncbi:MAG: hypothetical protein MRERV_3c014 [Mycoplasmataceae bacterium RV_VA103A]|nr:MAG: hypothetical protein MRERV_3c014 [Mycoplasmataceae bacterium RV_VA103A]